MLKDEEVNQAIEIISEELKCTSDDQVIRLILQCLPKEWWGRYSEIARLRIENKLIQNIKDGAYDTKMSKCLAGWLATWSNAFFPYFRAKI